MGREDHKEAGFGARVGAKLVDYAIAVAASMAVSLVLPLPSGFGFYLGLAVFCSYIFLCDGLPGGSLGKRLFKLAVVNWRTGARCTYGESFVRNVTFVFMGGILKLWQEYEEQSARKEGRYSGTVVISVAQPPVGQRVDDPNRKPMSFDLTEGVRADSQLNEDEENAGHDDG